MVGVNLQEDSEAVRAFGKEFSIPFPLLLDPEDRVQKLFGVRGHPSSVLLDRRGRIVGRILGERDWHGEAARQLVRSLLESGE